jgi:hypothetical protein
LIRILERRGGGAAGEEAGVVYVPSSSFSAFFRRFLSSFLPVAILVLSVVSAQLRLSLLLRQRSFLSSIIESERRTERKENDRLKLQNNGGEDEGDAFARERLDGAREIETGR